MGRYIERRRRKGWGNRTEERGQNGERKGSQRRERWIEIYGEGREEEGKAAAVWK